MRKISSTVLMFLVLISSLLGATALAHNYGRALSRGGGERHPKIHQAINALQVAKGDLQNAAHDFCGHRVEALEAVNEAIKQLNLALESDQAMNTQPNGPSPAMAGYATPPGGSATAGERHPMIRRAINALDAARTDLQQAAHDFKGHRAEALEAVNKAQSQLRQALACDKN